VDASANEVQRNLDRRCSSIASPRQYGPQDTTADATLACPTALVEGHHGGQSGSDGHCGVLEVGPFRDGSFGVVLGIVVEGFRGQSLISD
jgi:hypothetical protein